MLFQIYVEVLQNQVQLGPVLAVDDVEKLDDAGVVELLEEADLSQGRGGNPLVAMLDLNFFESDDL